MKEKMNKGGRGVPANALVMPIVAVLAVLHAAIVFLIISINSTSSSLSHTMQNAGLYTQDASSLLAGSSLLSETSSNFVLMPLTDSGEVSVGPLSAYAQELTVDRRGDQVLARFRTYEVYEEEIRLLTAAAESANFMLQTQLHAISLIRSVYPLPPVPTLSAIPMVELTEEEQAMTPEQRLAAARALVLDSAYAQNKYTINQSVNACVARIQQHSAQRSAETSRHIRVLRGLLWVVAVSVMAILIATFILLYSQLIMPLNRFVRLIPEDQPLDEKKGLREVRLVAGAYNGVLRRRNDLDQILRAAAETDALTNLPNRYRLEQYLVESQESGCSLAVVLFDVNYLKRTNDTLGHLAGDQLIRHAAECISACFGENCFRFGGDEFAAILRDCTPQDIDERMHRFEEVEKRENVSVSTGYAYTDEIGKTTIRSLLDEADRKMYAQKKIMHAQRTEYKVESGEPSVKSEK